MSFPTTVDLVVDTDVTSALWRDDLPEDYRHILGVSSPALTFVTQAETRYGAYKARWGKPRINRFQAFCDQNFLVLDWDDAIPEAYARLYAGSSRIGFEPPENDCWIAAACVTFGLPLLTLNQKHFAPLVRFGLSLA